MPPPTTSLFARRRTALAVMGALVSGVGAMPAVAQDTPPKSSWASRWRIV
ncbi:MAG: hypothetical protein IPJ18_21210 [Betaproteobacteria bacterium]|nr:hypothetical protein [Betaproteobacteria bacterium]